MVYAGYEYGYVIRRRQNPTSIATPDGLLLTGQLVWTPPLSGLHETTVSLSGGHHAFFSSTAAYQRVTRVQLGLRQELPADLEASANVNYELQLPRAGPGLDLESIACLAGLRWSPFDWFAASAQVRYVHSYTDATNVEVFEFGLGLTLSY